MSIPTLLTVKQFSQKHTAFPIGGLRCQIFNETRNGMKSAGVIVRNGRRVLIDEKLFFEWLKGVRK